MSLSYRLAEPADADAASHILTVALSDLAVRQGRPPFTGPADHAAPALRHVLETDGARFWVAVADGRPVAFGSAWERGGERGRLGYCSGLFVAPEWQGKGVGRHLFELAMDRLPAAGGVAALTSSAANPISNGLYARHGVFPLHALLYLTGPLASFATGERAAAKPAAARPAGRVGTRPESGVGMRPAGGVGTRPASGGKLAAEPLTAAHLNELRVIDEAVLGVDRSLEHRWFLGWAENPGWLFRRGGRAIGYAYLGGDGTEGAGALGPIATLRPQDQPAVLRFALAELAARGAAQATVAVPGPNIAAQRLLWESGFTFPAATGLLCASRPFGCFDRYLLAGDCLL
jgi:ribosomal protein S18 acetylase RimI-like enzyme